MQRWLWDKLPHREPDTWYPVINLDTYTKRFFLKDLTGRGFTNKSAELDQILALDEQGDENLQAWAIDATEGDEWANAAVSIICIHD